MSADFPVPYGNMDRGDILSCCIVLGWVGWGDAMAGIIGGVILHSFVFGMLTWRLRVKEWSGEKLEVHINSKS